jgi:hypothetical protein
VSEFFDRIEDRLNEIAQAAESCAISFHRCADAVEMFVEYVLHPDDGDPPRWPLVVVQKDDGV